MQIKNLPTAVADRFLANYQVIYLESDEPQRCFEAIDDAAKLIKDHEKGSPQLQIVMWDKWAGFYRGQPDIAKSADGTNKLSAALPLMMAGDKRMKQTHPKLMESGTIDPKKDIIFVIKEAESEILGMPDGPGIVQFLKNMVSSNMCAVDYATKLELGERGQRMIVFVSSAAKLPPNLPEFHPIPVPLPDKDVLQKVVDSTFGSIEDLWLGKGSEKKGVRGWVTPAESRDAIAQGLTGLTLQAAEDALSLAVAKTGDSATEMDGKTKILKNINPLIEVIEDQKSIHIGGVPGLEYISRDLTNNIELAGYEAAMDFIDTSLHTDPALLKKHKMGTINGLTFVGPPGTGKTMIGYLMSRITGRILIKWSLGESKGGVVGASEANARRAIQIGQAMGAVMLLDDIDKGMLGSGGGSYSGDGGTSGNMIQMLLTEMSRPDNRALWCFTLNRVQNVPPELIRPGRMDAVFYVQRPDEITRRRVAEIHLKKRNFTWDHGVAQLEEFSTITDEWVPAEIEAYIKNAGMWSLRHNNGVFSFERLLEQAKNYTPMSRQDVYRNDLEAMEKFSQQFIKIGRVEQVAKTKTDGARAKRSLM